MRFLRERIRLTQRARKVVKREAESMTQSIKSSLSTEDGAEVWERLDQTPSESLIPPKTIISSSLKNFCARNMGVVFLKQEHLMLTKLSGL